MVSQRWVGLELGLAVVLAAACFPGERPIAANVECGENDCHCTSGFADCDDDPGSGCEAAVSSDPNNCGACGVRCNGACAAGACLLDQCDPGFADCNDEGGDGCEAELATDVEHCGACSHACHDGACVNGHCEPFELVDRGLWAISMDADDGFVYFCENIAGAIYRVAVEGTEVETMVSDQRCGWRSWDGLPGLIAAAGGHLYWTTGVWAIDGWTYIERLHSMPVAGGSNSVLAPSDLFDHEAAFLALAASDDHVVWSLKLGTGEVLIEAASAGGIDPVLVTIAGKDVDELAVSGNSVFWVEPVKPVVEGAPDSLIKRAELGTIPQPEVLLAGVGIANLSAWGEHVYWTSQDPDTSEYLIMRQPAAGGIAERVYAAKRRFGAVLPDASEVYFVEEINDIGVGLFGVSLDSGAVTTYTGSHYVYAVTADEQLIFWADYTDRIFALAK